MTSAHSLLLQQQWVTATDWLQYLAQLSPSLYHGLLKHVASRESGLRRGRQGSGDSQLSCKLQPSTLCGLCHCCLVLPGAAVNWPAIAV